MTAAGIDALSGGRFQLGLGASGPQVIEGFHGVPYDAPVGRTREIIDICRQVWARKAPVVHPGPRYTVPLPPDQGTNPTPPHNGTTGEETYMRGRAIRGLATPAARR